MGEPSTHDASSAARVLTKQPDHMGAWSDGGDIVWLPRSLYPKRSGAIKWAVDEFDAMWTDVRCTTVWMRYEPEGGEDFWREVEDGFAPDAFRAWRLEAV